MRFSSRVFFSVRSEEDGNFYSEIPISVWSICEWTFILSLQIILWKWFESTCEEDEKTCHTLPYLVNVGRSLQKTCSVTSGSSRSRRPQSPWNNCRGPVVIVVNCLLVIVCCMMRGEWACRLTQAEVGLRLVWGRLHVSQQQKRREGGTMMKKRAILATPLILSFYAVLLWFVVAGCSFTMAGRIMRRDTTDWPQDSIYYFARIGVVSSFDIWSR